jgi:hypothetical protein
VDPELDADDPDAPKKPTRAKIIRTVLAVSIALACGGVFAYVRWGMKKANLGEPCAYKVNCGPDAPTCMKPNEKDDGVCSRPCDHDAGTECAPGIACVKVELEERDDRGVPLEGGYCFPQALLDARKKKKPAAEAGAPKDSYVDVPEVAGQLEGEIEMKWERASGATTATYQVKGTLVRSAGPGKKRTIADAAAMRVYVVDDEKHTFGASAYEGAAPVDGVKLTKTDAKEQIAGRSCDVWRIDEPKTSHDVCVVTGGAFVDPTARNAPAWLRELSVRTAFPLRMAERDGKTKMTVTRLDAHAMDAALFAIPRSYKNLAGGK